MIVECSDCTDRQCVHGDCVVAALHSIRTALPTQPDRPDWILDAPPTFDARELEAIAVLSDAGLVPPLLPPVGAPSAIAGEEDDAVYWPVRAVYDRTG